MKVDWKETFRYYKNLIDFPHSDNKQWCYWYQNECRVYLDEALPLKKKENIIVQITDKLFKKDER